MIASRTLVALAITLAAACSSVPPPAPSGVLPRKPAAVEDVLDAPVVEVRMAPEDQHAPIPADLFARAGEGESDAPSARMARAVRQAMDNSRALQAVAPNSDGTPSSARYRIELGVKKMHREQASELPFIERQKVKMDERYLCVQVELAYALIDNVSGEQLGEGREVEEVMQIRPTRIPSQDRFKIEHLFNTDLEPYLRETTLRAIDRLVCDVAAEIARRQDGSSVRRDR